MAASSDISAGDTLLASQYNNLRTDVVNITTGHDHDGSDSKSMSASDLLGRVLIRKPSNEVVDNSTTLQNDDDFAFSVGVNEVWIGHMMLLLDDESGTGTPGIKLDWSLPSGATFSTYSGYYDNSADSVASVQDSQDFSPFYARSVLIDSGPTFDWIRVDFILVIGGTAGTAQLQWAQNSANVNGTVIQVNSYLVAQRV